MQEVASRYRRIITIEDGVTTGGLGSAVLEWLSDHQRQIEVVRMGLPDRFVEHGTPAELYHLVGIDKEAILRVLTHHSSSSHP